jgi:class 3 adenylate cyclase
VLFTDIVGSTEKVSAAGDLAWRALIERHHAVVRAMLGRYRGGRAGRRRGRFLRHVRRARAGRKCAKAIADAVSSLDIEVRAGPHTGEVGTVGDKASGIAVNVAGRVATLARPSEILCIADREGVGRRVERPIPGSRQPPGLKGVEGSWQLCAVI